MSNAKAPTSPPTTSLLENFPELWGTASLSAWLYMPGATPNDPMVALDSVTGYLAVLTKEELGFDPSGGGHAKWLLAVYQPGEEWPSAVIPGCKVDGVTFHARKESNASRIPFERGDDLALRKAGTEGAEPTTTETVSKAAQSARSPDSTSPTEGVSETREKESPESETLPAIQELRRAKEAAEAEILRLRLEIVGPDPEAPEPATEGESVEKVSHPAWLIYDNDIDAAIERAKAKDLDIPPRDVVGVIADAVTLRLHARITDLYRTATPRREISREALRRALERWSGSGVYDAGAEHFADMAGITLADEAPPTGVSESRKKESPIPQVTEEMVEAAAKAAYEVDTGGAGSWDRLSGLEREQRVAFARTTLTAGLTHMTPIPGGSDGE